ncbi:major facilitator superfamily domain-containing protein [Crucibulum laeve]|uniref:Major facilitator superfamily domain-containing protein n=1 Tax=Crucibulum laeve TaxID=68775 RepID=A0A5C3LSP8_9AGAR|nr:major facilitator superfamily domain-containing protein [Crucibulum laeve]
MSTNSPIPGIVSVPRLTTLFASLIVALSSGTNYVYSAYSPQLGSRLHITHTQLNIVALAGNIGVYSSGPIWGRIVDTRGPRILLVGAFLLLLSGYSGIRHMFNAGLPEGAKTLSAFSFWLLVTCSYMTGAGGNGGLTSSVNATAKTFPDHARASTTGLVISGFGLSAFLFSTISHVAYAGNTSAFLLLLALGTSVPMLLGIFFVRPIPLPPNEGPNTLEQGARTHGRGASASALERDDSQARLLDHDALGDRTPLAGEDSPPLSGYSQDEHALELSPSSSPEQHRRRSLSSSSRRSMSVAEALSHGEEDTPNIYGRRLFFSGDFWLLFSILSILSGTRLMYINNVGSMSQALFSKNNPNYDQVEAACWQSAQVSSISLMNFSGRIFIGLVSDYGKNRYALPRSYCLVISSTFVLISQIAAANIEDVRNLWIASALLGLAHGSVFSLFPTVCIEWFGLPHFSENWGYLSMSPMLAGNFFSVIFGRNLDAHEAAPKTTIVPRAPIESSGPQCLEGLECYVSTIRLTIIGALVALCLSVWAGWRDRQKLAAAHRSKSAQREVIWEEVLED